MLRWAAVIAVALLGAVPGEAAAADVLGHWPLDEGSGQVTADVSGHGHDGVLGDSPGPDAHDPAWVTGRIGGGLRFEGAYNQYVAIQAPTTLAPQLLTVEAWIRRAGTPGRWRYVVSSGGLGCDFASFGLYSGVSGGLAFYVSDDTHYVLSPAAAPEAVWDGNWHHAVGIYDGGRVRLYVDGAEVGGGTPTQLRISYGLPERGVYIGTYRGTCERPFTGDVDEVVIRNGALTATQVASRAGTIGGQALPPQAPPVAGPPARSCFAISVRPRRVRAHRRSRLRIAVRRLGRSAPGRRVVVRGLGVRRSVKTGRRGRAKLVVRPRRSGRLRVSVRGQPRGCNARHVKVFRRAPG